MKSVNHKQLGKLIKEAFKKKKPLFIWGGTGIGKSVMVRETAMQIAKEKGLAYNEDITKINDKGNFSVVDVRVSQMDISDIRGLPKFDEETKTTRWYFPNFLPKNSQGLIFLDELNLASPMVQASCYSLVLDKRVGDYILPPNWAIISAGNRLEDKANVFETPAPLNNRFIHIELEVPSVDDWVDNFAIRNKIDTRISTFLKFKPCLYKFDKNVKDKAFCTPRCIKGDSKILVADGSLKSISDINIGEKIIGFENGSFIISTVLNKFENNSIKTKYEIDSGKNQIVCSGEHKFLTDMGYVKAMNLKRYMPIHVYGLSILHERGRRIYKTKLSTKKCDRNIENHRKTSKSPSAKNSENAFETMEFFTKPFIDTDGVELLGRFNRWGRMHIHLQKKQDKRKSILRMSNECNELFSFICGLAENYRISCSRRKKTKRLAKQIYSNTLRNEIETSIRFIDSILKDKETADVVNKGIYNRKNEAKTEGQTHRNNENDRIAGYNKTFKLKATPKIISVRKGNNSEIFYDLMTTSSNYIANGFITHNSWAICSEMISDKETRDLDTINILVASCVGEATAIEFTAWLKLSEKIDIEEILKNPLESKLPREIDMTYAMISGILEHYKKDRKLMKPIVQLATRLTPEFAVMMLKLVKTHNTRFVEEVVNLPEWKKDLAKKLQPYFKDETD